jgi:hypothetical protein
MSKKTVPRKLTLGVLCGVVLGITLTAGLWPFHAPRNQVHWLRDQDGLHFGKRGSIKSSGEVPISVSKADAALSLEAWLEPDTEEGLHTILAFYDPENATIPFALRQYRDGLYIDNSGDPQSPGKRRFGVGDVFHPGRRVFVTITSDTQKTSVYANGLLVRAYPAVGGPIKNLSGELVMANSPIELNGWTGNVLGLAMYSKKLTPVQVVRHFQSWTKSHNPEIGGDEAPVALYLFNERSGNIVYNHAGSGPQLVIPERYFVLHPHFLRAAWAEFEFNRSYWKDVGVNVIGLTPLGFVFCAFFSSVLGLRRAGWATIGLGLAVSLTIELLQVLLPTRQSGTTDLITNTLGTAIGVMFYRNAKVRAQLARLGFSE